MKFSILDIIDKLNIDGKLIGDENAVFSSASSVFYPKEDSITFCDSKNFNRIEKIVSSINPSVIILPKNINVELNKKNMTYFLVDDPMSVFIQIVDYCFPKVRNLSGIHSTAIITDAVTLGKNVTISPYCTIGFEGFGFIKKDGEEKYHNFPHYERVIIEDDVEIFPFTNIDRGALTDTVIGKGTKIDHYCHIGHNVKIGKNCIITACVVIAGSVTIGDNVYIGINSSIRDYIHIGNNVTIGMGSVVVRDVPDNMIVYGNPAKNHKKEPLEKK